MIDGSGAFSATSVTLQLAVTNSTFSVGTFLFLDSTSSTQKVSWIVRYNTFSNAGVKFRGTFSDASIVEMSNNSLTMTAILNMGQGADSTAMYFVSLVLLQSTLLTISNNTFQMVGGASYEARVTSLSIHSDARWALQNNSWNIVADTGNLRGLLISTVNLATNGTWYWYKNLISLNSGTGNTFIISWTSSISINSNSSIIFHGNNFTSLASPVNSYGFDAFSGSWSFNNASFIVLTSTPTRDWHSTQWTLARPYLPRYCCSWWCPCF